MFDLFISCFYIITLVTFPSSIQYTHSHPRRTWANHRLNQNFQRLRAVRLEPGAVRGRRHADTKQGGLRPARAKTQRAPCGVNEAGVSTHPGHRAQKKTWHIPGRHGTTVPLQPCTVSGPEKNTSTSEGRELIH